MDQAKIKSLPIREAADDVAAKTLDRFPPLISDVCFTGSEVTLVAFATSWLRRPSHIPSEVVAMPRSGFGPRPVSLMGAAHRVVYSGLVAAIASALPPPTRGPGKWTAFDEFGRPSGAEEAYVVGLDVAAFYEYVNHKLLRDELTLHALDVDIADAIIGVLDELFPSGLGLPQMMGASDLLADTYLAAVERSLRRRGHDLVRYADDFKILASDWEQATQVIEEASGLLRKVGLVLSPDKTGVQKASTLEERSRRLATFLNSKFEEVRRDVSAITELFSDYTDDESEEETSGDAATEQEVYLQVLLDWRRATASDSTDETDVSIEARMIGPALYSLRAADERLSDDVIKHIVFKQPLRLDSVLRYVLSRSELGANWHTVRALIEMDRQTPWSRIWMAWGVSELAVFEEPDGRAVIEKLRGYLSEPHEFVRAQAAWALATHSAITPGDLSALYERASLMTRPGLAAALARLGEATDSPIAKAVRGDSPLIRVAFDWGQGQVPR